MNIEKFTLKSQEAIKNSVDLAIKKQNQFVVPMHLLEAILETNDNVIESLIEKSGGNLELLKDKTKKELSKIPSVSGENIESTFSQEYNLLLLKAKELADKSNDTYITLERLFQAFFIFPNKVQELLKECNLEVQKSIYK